MHHRTRSARQVEPQEPRARHRNLEPARASHRRRSTHVCVCVQHTTRWVGWPGSCIPEGKARDDITAALRERHASEPVWVPKDTLDLYYNGFCNAVLWQLFHYVPVQMDFRLAEAPTLQQEWAAYQAANEMFADAVLEGYHDGEVVWIQDYHLMLLPDILKQRRPTMKVRRPCRGSPSAVPSAHF